MTEPDNSIEPLNSQEQEILLEVYRQRSNHVRHVQQMRATYFNLYVAVIGFGVAAAAGIYKLGQGLPWEAILPIGGLIWVMSILTMMRSERWGGHISHDTRAIREIQNIFSSQHKVVAKVMPVNPTPLKSLEYDRPLWDRNRSIETPASVLGAIVSGLIVAFAMSPDLWGAIVGVLLIVIPILLWRGEVSNLKKRHAKCCMR
jgi:hypothetical protein